MRGRSGVGTWPDGKITKLAGFPETIEFGVGVASDGSRAVVVGVEKNGGLSPSKEVSQSKFETWGPGELVKRLEDGGIGRL